MDDREADQAVSLKHLRTKSHRIKGSETVWWYEDNAGIDVIVHPKLTCQSIKISWKALRAALARKDKK